MIVFKYLNRQIYAWLLATLMIILCIFLANQLVVLTQRALQGDISPSIIAKLLVCFIPLFMGYLLPLALFVSIIIGLGQLYQNSEMVALQAGGVSTQRLFGYLLLLILCISGVAGFITFYLGPLTENYRATLIEEAKNTLALDVLTPGTFITFPKGKGVIYADQVGHDRAKGVFIARQVGDSWEIIQADQVKQNKEFLQQSQQFWQIERGQRYIENPKDAMNNNVVANKNNKENSHMASVEAPQTSQIQLHRFVQMQIQAPNQSSENSLRKVTTWPTTKLWSEYSSNRLAAAEYQWRIAVPISVCLLALIAIPLARVNPRQGKYGKLFPALLIYIIYANGLYLMRGWIGNGKVNETWGMWIIHAGLLSTAAICWYLMTRKMQRRPTLRRLKSY